VAVKSEEQIYLVGATNQERYHIAREQYINPKFIRLVNRPRDIEGFRGGRIIFGVTGVCEELSYILDYARWHDIEVP
jgi:hypothetical protein